MNETKKKKKRIQKAETKMLLDWGTRTENKKREEKIRKNETHITEKGKQNKPTEQTNIHGGRK
jgi:hypothetical protein